MTPKRSLPALLALASILPAAAPAGEPASGSGHAAARRGQSDNLPRRVALRIVAACGLTEFAPAFVAPGYLESGAPAAMRVYRARAVSHRRHVPSPAARPAPIEANSQPTPAAPEAAATGGNPVPQVGPPAPVLPEKNVLPDVGGSAEQDRTEELLSYFRRAKQAADPSGEPSFLQAPAVPPSSATYQVVP